MSRRVWFSIWGCAALLMSPAWARSPAEPPPAERLSALLPTELGLASYYSLAFDSLRTASGERFDRSRMTAAHRSLPFGTRVRVTNLRNGRSAVVRINDRGPFVKGRVLDVSRAAARRLGLLARGTERVRLEVLPASGRSSQRSSGVSG